MTVIRESIKVIEIGLIIGSFGQSPNMLDLIFSNEEGMICNVNYLPGLGRSDIQGIELEANISAETVWATISLKDQRKLVVGSYYRPPDSGSDSIDDLESVLSFITEKFRNNPQCTIILGGDFNAGDIDWESHTVCEHSLNRQINEKILSVISSSGLV